MLRILHFADAHIDIATQGRHDPETGLPVRMLDFLKSLDRIVDTAIDEKVDLVIFAGDAYKDRSPAPTFQREWGRRIIRLSNAGVPIILLVGNHDLSPAAGRANAMQEYETLNVPNVKLISKPCFLGPADLFGLPLQILALPWIPRSGLMAALQLSNIDPASIYREIESRLTELVNGWLDERDASLPVVMTAHCSVQGAIYGGERSVMLGSDLVLPGSLVKDTRLNYVALGHIHKAQDLNEGHQPPVVYPGSIERVDFGEARDDKYYVIAHVEAGQDTRVEWRKLNGRRFIDIAVRIETADSSSEPIYRSLPPSESLEGVVLRLVLDYPREWETQFDEAALRQYTAPALDFHLVRRPRLEARGRLPQDKGINTLDALDLLDIYWKSRDTDSGEASDLQKIAAEIIRTSNTLEINPAAEEDQ